MPDTDWDVLVLGGGWAGMSCAHALHGSDLKVAVIEKGRGPGGRCATRRHDDGWTFNHGAQYFTATTDAFNSQLYKWQALGWVEPWQAPIKVIGPRPDHLAPLSSGELTRWVGVPGNNAVLKALSDSINFFPNHRAEKIAWCEDHWQVHQASGGEEICWRAKRLVLTAPPKQAAELVGSEHPLWATLNEHAMAPTWALLVGFDAPSGLEAYAAFVNDGPIGWFAPQAYGSNNTEEAWVVHATPRWSEVHLEEAPALVEEALLSAWVKLVGPLRQPPAFISAHRWRYAQSLKPLNAGFLQDQGTQLWVAGDWCAGNRVEGAWLSGQQVAQSLTS